MVDTTAASALDTGPAASEPAAAPKVFAIPELLGNILTFSDTFDLYVYQSINTTFQGVIKESREIRKIMQQEGPYESWDLCTLLLDGRLKRAMFPFRPVFYWQYNWLAFVVSGQWLKAAVPSTDLSKLPCKEDASWRKIKAHEVVTWIDRYHLEEVDTADWDSPGNRYHQAGVDATLGEVMDAAIELLYEQDEEGYVFFRRAWKSNWKSKSVGGLW